MNQGRAAAGETSLNSVTPTDAQQALYMLPQSDYNSITSGNNGYTANAGYNLVTGLGTPVANLLVPDLIAYQGAGTVYSGSTVGPLQDAGLVNAGASSSSTIDVFSVFDALTVDGGGLSQGCAASLGGAPTVRGIARSTGAVGIVVQSPRAGSGAMGRSFVERTTTIGIVVQSPRAGSGAMGRSFAERTTTIADHADAGAAVDEVLGSLQADSGFDGATLDDLVLDLVWPQMIRSRRGRAIQ